MKASVIERAARFAALQKKLGPFEAANQRSLMSISAINLTTNEQQSEAVKQKSKTLEMLNILPKTVCADCQNAVWQSPTPAAKGVPTARVYCRLMHALVDETLTVCDGQMPMPEAGINETAGRGFISSENGLE